MKEQKSYKDIYGGLGGKTINTGLMMGVSIALCGYFGYEIGKYYGSTSKGLFYGCLIGIIAGFVNMIEELQRTNKKISEENDKCKEQLQKD